MHDVIAAIAIIKVCNGSDRRTAISGQIPYSIWHNLCHLSKLCNFHKMDKLCKLHKLNNLCVLYQDPIGGMA